MDNRGARGEAESERGFGMNLQHEKDIVWLDKRSKHRYLREVQYPIPGRTSKPRSSVVSGTLVAYATLKPTAPTQNPGMFVRRLFYVTSSDPYKRGEPVEAVDPYFVHPGIPATGEFESPLQWVEWQRAARVL